MSRNSETLKINGKEVHVLEEHKTNSEYTTKKRQVFIIGSKGIPASYGGFETFVENLTKYQVSARIQYHVSRISSDNLRYEYCGAKCFDVKVPNLGAAKAVYYDLAALKRCIRYCSQRPSIKAPVFYVLACRIGPFIGHYKKAIEKLGGTLYVNPDGHEWKRAKWSVPIKRYWKLSERLMVKSADLLVCDSKNIEKYIKQNYKRYHPKTTFIAYGADTKPSALSGEEPVYKEWLMRNQLVPGEYYLIVGRFVPENNFETMIREFMDTKSRRDLVIITTANEEFLDELEKKLHFKTDPRIKFAGSVYDQELLKKIREDAYGYLHGHEVGGTNPSLLEALSSTRLNLLLDISFNREVGMDTALYWNKNKGNLAGLIEKAEQLSDEERKDLGVKAKRRIAEAYSWNKIIDEYERLFLT